MIQLNQQICEELDLTYWQIATASSKQVSFSLNHEEKDLLRKILLAKGIDFSDEIIEVCANGVVIVNFKNLQLIFNDVNAEDSNNQVHLAKISDMLNSKDHKKKTWYKLKNLELY